MVLTAIQAMKGGHDTQDAFQSDKKLLFLSAMVETVSAQASGKLWELDLHTMDGLLVVCGRKSTGLQYYLGSNFLPVIMGPTRVAYLIMIDSHCKDHAGRDITVAMSRHEPLSKKIVKQGIRCRYLRKQAEGQKMAVLPDRMQVPSPPFSNIGVDLIGPITVKTMTNKRSTLKVWVAIFVCLNTKAVSMELPPGYSTADFLLAYSSC